MRIVRRSIAVLAAAVIPGCGAWNPAVVRPVPTVGRVASTAEAHSRLAVLLPGRGSEAADFRSRGLEADLIAAAGPIATVAVETHRGYYRDGLVATVLAEDILRPARAAGYTEIWLVGTSMGGVGALATLRRYPELVDGIVLLGPFLGEDDLIAKANRLGPDLGRLEKSEDPQEAFFEELWPWIDSADRPETRILLGFGTQDRYRAGQQRLAERLPADDLALVPGGHDWSAWRDAVRRLGARMKRTP